MQTNQKDGEDTGATNQEDRENNQETPGREEITEAKAETTTTTEEEGHNHMDEDEDHNQTEDTELTNEQWR